MSYLQDRREKNKRNIRWGAVALIVLIFIFFGSVLMGGLSYVTHVIAKPFVAVGNGIGNKFGGIVTAFSSKSALQKENDELKAKLSEQEALVNNYNSTLAEKERLEEILGRKDERREMILGAILSKPGQSLYDTLIIDIGENKGISEGDLVFALGNVPIGRIAQIYPSSAKVVLFSTAQEKTEVVISGENAFVEMIGRGGGNFEIVLPRDFQIEGGKEVVLPGLQSHVLAVVETIISDPRDSFSKALLVSPVNLYELRYVQVEI